MKNRNSWLLSVTVYTVLLISAMISATQANTYMEIESHEPVGDWELRTEHEGYFGEGYFFWTGPQSTGAPITSSILTYTVNIPEDGNYTFAIHGRRDKSARCSAHDDCNDVFVKIGDEAWHKKLVKVNQELVDKQDWNTMLWSEWLWDPLFSDGNPDMNLKAGELVIKIGNRSYETSIDAFRIYKTGTTPPDPPTSGIINKTKKIEITRKNTFENAFLYRHDGRKIKTLSGSSIARVNDQVKKGLYIIRIQTEGENYTKKILVH